MGLGSDSVGLPQQGNMSAEKGENVTSTESSWEHDSDNPYNWPQWKKNFQLAASAIVGFSGFVHPEHGSTYPHGTTNTYFCLARSIGTSIISPAHQQLVDEFGVSSTAAFIPLTTYVLALGLGPVVGGPLSETAGRKNIYVGAAFLGGLFSLGAGFTTSFAGLCILRFLAGFAYGPSLSVASGFLAETYIPAERGLASSLFILSPFIGSGLG